MQARQQGPEGNKLEKSRMWPNSPASCQHEFDSQGKEKKWIAFEKQMENKYKKNYFTWQTTNQKKEETQQKRKERRGKKEKKKKKGGT